jgi:putative membrane protein
MKRLLALAPVIAVLAAAPAFAQQQAATGGAATGKLSQEDRMFLDKAASGGLAEVEEGRLAEQKASKDAVKDFGRRMVTDHSKANEQLMAVANQLGAKPPTQPDAKDKASADRLKGLNGAAFDRAYMEAQVKDHKETVALFEKEAKSGQDPQLKQFAAQTLPTLKEHMEMAEKIGTK